VLLALTANSPFHDGADTRYASWRQQMWRRWPSAGPPAYVSWLEEYESRVDGLLRAGAIVDRGMIYWDVRLSEHEPTVEVRISDVAVDVPDAALLAVLVRGLAMRALHGSDDTPGATLPQEVLAARLWRSARDGLAGQCVDPVGGELVPAWRVIDDLVAGLRDQLQSTADADFVADTLARLRTEGGGAQRQRAAFARRKRLTDVVDSLAWPAPER
jgi:carboxylate-amine ligase